MAKDIKIRDIFEALDAALTAVETAQAALAVAQQKSDADIARAKEALDVVTSASNASVTTATAAFVQAREAAQALQADLQTKMSGLLDVTSRVRVS